MLCHKNCFCAVNMFCFDKINRGIQVIILSATNKTWNLEALQAAEADGFFAGDAVFLAAVPVFLTVAAVFFTAVPVFFAAVVVFLSAAAGFFVFAIHKPPEYIALLYLDFIANHAVLQVPASCRFHSSSFHLVFHVSLHYNTVKLRSALLCGSGLKRRIIHGYSKDYL